MTKRLTLGAALLLLSSLASILVFARGQAQSSLQAKTAVTGEEPERLLTAGTAGKKLFVERCAKCHDERGDKPLSTGLPLSQRELFGEKLARAVSGRLKNAPDEDKRAVTLYVSSFMTKK